MKFNKIISALLAAGMMMSALTTATYAYTDDAPQVIPVVAEYEAVEGNAVYDYFMSQEIDPAEELGDDYTAYLVEIKLAGITLGRKTSGSTANQRLSLLRVFYEVSGSAKADAIFDTTYYDGQIGDPDNNIVLKSEYDNQLFSYAVGSGTAFFPTTGTSIVEYTEEEPTDPVVVFLVKIKKGTQLVLTPVEGLASSMDGLNTPIDYSYVQTMEYVGKTAGDSLQYKYGVDEGLAMTTSTITLGTAAPSEPDPVVTSIEIAADSDAVMAVNGAKTLTATVKDEKGEAMAGETVAWTSDSDVATVSGGVVTAKKPGKATITATSTTNGTVKATYEVKVLPQVVMGDAANYTKGEDKYVIWKNISVTGSTWGTAYKVTFSADAVESVTKDISFGELSGDFAFPMLLKTANTGVAAAINCTWTDAQ